MVAWIEKELDMPQVSDAVTDLDVLVSNAREVSSSHEGSGCQPKQIDKIREVAVLVQCLDRPRKRDAVVRGEFGERRRTHRANHVHMQLRLGEAREKCREVVRGWRLDRGGVDRHNSNSWKFCVGKIWFRTSCRLCTSVSAMKILRQPKAYLSQ